MARPSTAGAPARASRPPLSIACSPALILLCLLVCIHPAAAQDTREELLRLEQEQKRRELTPPQPNDVERWMDRIDDWGLIGGEARGLYPWVGSVYSGGGLAAGTGLRTTFGDDGSFNLFGGYSMARFGRAEAGLALPTFAQNRARLTLSARVIDAPDVRFFGVGNASRRGGAGRFGYRPASAGARLDLHAARHLSIGGRLGVLDVGTSGGRTSPSIETMFLASDVPGLGVPGFTFITSTAYAIFDSRASLGYAGSGGLYRIQVDDYRERDDERYSFTSVEAELQRLIPILRANWVVALRALATVTDLGETKEVPFFLLPSLGGGGTLRGYPDFRFRDRNRLLMNAELRWTPARFVDMAVFYDVGRVASRRQDLTLRGLKDSYGIGMRLVGAQAYFLRFEVAHSREHAGRVIVTAGGVF